MAAIDEDRLRQVERVRRSRKILPLVIVLLWIMQLGILYVKVPTLLDSASPLGIDTLSELTRAAFEVDPDQKRFHRFEVFIIREGYEIAMGILSTVLITVFLLSTLPLFRLIEWLAAGGRQDHDGSNV